MYVQTQVTKAKDTFAVRYDNHFNILLRPVPEKVQNVTPKCQPLTN